ncbi:MAG: hypothetical protein KBD76_06075 [Bacteriovorax sp.]|nr:hypothetical protein [Bacteriovorax sp.]
MDHSGSSKQNFWGNTSAGALSLSSLDESSTNASAFAHSTFNPSEFFIPGWRGEGLITSSAIVIKNTLSNLTIDALLLFKKSCAGNKSLKLQTYNEFLLFADYAKLDKTLLSQQNDFWLHLQDETSPLKKHLDDFVKIHCFRAVAIYLFRIKFILDLSKEQHLPVTEDILLNPLSFLGRIFKKDSSTELFCDSLQINQFSWYRPSSEYKDSLLKLKVAFENITLTELIKLISTPKDDQIYSIRNYSHALSHLSFGQFVNELLIKIPTWLYPKALPKTINPHKLCILPKTINTRFAGNHISSFALSHWLAQETNIKISQWDNLICPEFEGLEFIDGQFLKICQELQFLSFLTRVAVEHKYEIIPFICKIMREKYHHSPEEAGGSQVSFFNLENLSANNETLFNRIILNVTELPKTNPHHYLIQQIQSQKSLLKKDGMIFVFSNQKLFVPSHSERVEQLLKDFKFEACFNLEELKGKGEIAHYIYVLTKRGTSPGISKHFFEVNKKVKESCLSFEFKGTLSRFNKFSKLVEELQHFTRHKNSVTTPIYLNEIESDLSFEFHQDAIIEGKLVSSVSTKENGHLPHPSFFKNLTKSCTSLETFFHIEQITQDDYSSIKKSVASELLGLRFGPEKQYPLLLIIDQTDAMNVKIELTTTDSYRAKIEQYGTAFFYYFGLIPKNQVINLNVFREFFTSILGHQIIQLQLSDGPSKLKAKLKSLLIPSFFAKTQVMPSQIKELFALLDYDARELKAHHPYELQAQFEKIKAAFGPNAQLFPWHLLGLLSHFKLQVTATLEDFESNRPNSFNFNNPYIAEALVKLKTQAIYPNNPDVYIDYKIKTHQELQLPLTSVQIKNVGEESILEFKSDDKDIVHLHSANTMNHFLKFILQQATGVKIADILLNLKIPSIPELEEVTNNVEQIKISKSNLLKETEDLISTILRTQISK